MRYLSIAISILLTLLFLSSCSQEKNKTIGYITADYIFLSSPVSGTLLPSSIQQGDSVTAHQQLFSLDPMPEQQIENVSNNTASQQRELLEDMMEAERDPIIQANQALLKQAESKRNLAKLTFGRTKHLYESNMVSAEQYDIDRSNYHSSQQNVDKAKANLINSTLASREHQIKAQRYSLFAAQANHHMDQWQLKQKSISAPTSGIINEIYYQPGEYITNGQPIASLLAPEHTYLKFYINEKELSTIKLGQTIQFTCDNCKADNKATINYIASNSEYTPPVIYSNQSRNKLVYEIHAQLTKQQALQFHPGQPIQLSLSNKG